jgi:hypothetical protein
MPSSQKLPQFNPGLPSMPRQPLPQNDWGSGPFPQQMPQLGGQPMQGIFGGGLPSWFFDLFSPPQQIPQMPQWDQMFNWF